MGENLERWRYAVERRRMKISYQQSSKISYVVQFGNKKIGYRTGNIRDEDVEVLLGCE